MANYLQRVVTAGARTTSPARPPASAPAMIPGLAVRPEPVRSAKPEAPKAVGPLPQPRSAQPESLPINVQTLPSVPAVQSPTPQHEVVETPAPSPVVHQHIEQVVRQEAAAPRSAEKITPPSRPEPPKPVAPVFFRFQKPPVQVVAPRAMRPPRPQSPEAPAPDHKPQPRYRPPEPISIPTQLPVSAKTEAAAVPPPQSAMEISTAPKSALPPQQVPVLPPMRMPAPKQTVEATPVPKAAPLGPPPPVTKQKRIHIGAVEVHVHNQTPPAAPPKPPAPPRIDPPSHSDPFEQRSLSRFAFRL